MYRSSQAETSSHSQLPSSEVAEVTAWVGALAINAAIPQDKGQETQAALWQHIVKAEARVEEAGESVKEAREGVKEAREGVKEAREGVKIAQQRVDRAFEKFERADEVVGALKRELHDAERILADLQDRAIRFDDNNEERRMLAAAEKKVEASRQKLTDAGNDLDEARNNLDEARNDLHEARKALEKREQALEKREQALEKTHEALKERQKVLQMAGTKSTERRENSNAGGAGQQNPSLDKRRQTKNSHNASMGDHCADFNRTDSDLTIASSHTSPNAEKSSSHRGAHISILDTELGIGRCGPVFLAVVDGVQAAVKNTRWATKSNDANVRVMHESSLYERFENLQGIAIPRLLISAHQDGFFVEMVTERALQGWKEEWTEEELQSALEALGAIHGEGYIHGDIRRQNVVFTSEGKALWIDLETCREGSEEERTSERKRVEEGNFDP
ncbi:hypothetical protein HDU97_006481 [Phlyctochytrium planicorne]|nr:hypothetical protein HDU97_006481 [Phlyctochytrium planicorne]